MSESNSSSHGESGYSYSSKKSSSTGESSSYSYSSPTPIRDEEPKPQLRKVKDILKKIDAYVSNGLSTEEKEIFSKIYRKIIINNEKEVIAFPNTNFFISQFEENAELSDNLKEKIIKSLYAYNQLEREQKSKLKYW